MDEGSIVLDYFSPPGTSIDETDRILTEVDSIVLQTPEVASYSRRTGTQMGFFITEPNRGDYLIALKKHHRRTTDEVIADIRHRIENSVPALQVDFGQVIGDMLGDLMSSVQPIELKVFGPDREKLKEYATQITQITEATPGTADVFGGLVIAGPNITLHPDYGQLARFGLSPEDLQYQVQTAVQGQVVGSVLEKQQLTDIRMIYPNGPDITADQMRQLHIILPGGGQVPLSSLATVEVRSGVAEEERENLQPIVAVTARLEGRDLGSVMKDIRKQIREKVALHKGLRRPLRRRLCRTATVIHRSPDDPDPRLMLVLIVQIVLFRRLGRHC